MTNIPQNYSIGRTESKEIELIEYREQQLPKPAEGKELSHIEIEHNQLYSQLSTENKLKFDSATNNIYKLAKKLSIDFGVPQRNFLFYLNDRMKSLGEVVIAREGYYFVRIKAGIINNFSVEEIENVLAHEYIGHIIFSHSYTKFSESISISYLGLATCFNKKTSNLDKKITNIKNQNDYLINLFKNKTSLEVMADAMNEHLISLKVQKSEIGTDLDEAVTDYISILLRIPIEKLEEVITIVKKSGYMVNVYKLLTLTISLDIFEKSLGTVDFMNILIKAKMKNQPGLIIKFLKDQTGVTLKPKELFALDFSRVLAELNN